MKLGTQIAMVFGICVIITVTLGVTGYIMFSRIDADAIELSEHTFPPAKYATVT